MIPLCLYALNSFFYYHSLPFFLYYRLSCPDYYSSFLSLFLPTAFSPAFMFLNFFSLSLLSWTFAVINFSFNLHFSLICSPIKAISLPSTPSLLFMFRLFFILSLAAVIINIYSFLLSWHLFTFFSSL